MPGQWHLPPCPSTPGFPSILGVSQEYPRTESPTPPVQVSQDSLVSWVYPRNIPGQSHLHPLSKYRSIPGVSVTYTPCPSIPVSRLYPRTESPTPPVQVSQDSLVSWVQVSQDSLVSWVLTLLAHARIIRVGM